MLILLRKQALRFARSFQFIAKHNARYIQSYLRANLLSYNFGVLGKNLDLHTVAVKRPKCKGRGLKRWIRKGQEP
jgi:hypothetical protein